MKKILPLIIIFSLILVWSVGSVSAQEPDDPVQLEDSFFEEEAEEEAEEEVEEPAPVEEVEEVESEPITVEEPVNDQVEAAEEVAPVEDLEEIEAPVEVVDPVNERLAASGISGQNAKIAPWNVAITYQNVGSSQATIQVNFYEEGSGTAIPYSPPALAAGAGASFGVGKVNNISAGFQGSAVFQSDSPLVATAVQYASGLDMRLVSNGFQSTDASDQYLIATALKNQWDRDTVFSIQNADSETIEATIRFYEVGSTTPASTKVFNIPAKSTKYIDMGDDADTGLSAYSSFNGSAIVTAVRASDGSTAADVVAAASEYYTNKDVAANFEGVPLSKAATTIYLPTGLCERFDLDTFYAVQNASLSDKAYIEVTYYNTDGSQQATDGRYEIAAGGKKSIRTCAPSDGTDMTGFTGSAVIQSYNGNTGSTAGAPIVAIGKAQDSASVTNKIAFTAFLSADSGESEIALPFIRWANSTDYVASNAGAQRTYIAVQNVGSSTSKVIAYYNDKNGNTVASETLTIGPFAKGNTNPNGSGAVANGGSFGMKTDSFGYYTDGSYGAGVILEAHPDNPNAEFIAIVRAQNAAGAKEDYNGMVVP